MHLPRVLLVAYIGLVLPSFNCWSQQEVLIVCDENPQMEALAKFLREEGKCRVRIVGQDVFPDELSQYRAVFNFVHRPLIEKVEKGLIEYALAGGRLITLHHGISSSKMLNKKWLPFCGVALLRGEREKRGWSVLGNTTAELVNLRPSHYITSHKVSYEGTTTYTPSDSPSTEQTCPVLRFPDSEVFLNQHFTDGREKQVLFGIKGSDPQTGKIYAQDRGGWFRRKGKGLIFYFQVGHGTSDFRNRSYCQILLNCLTWDDEGDSPEKAQPVQP